MSRRYVNFLGGLLALEVIAGLADGESLLAYTGLRFGELAALRVGRVDLMRRRLIVAESVTVR